ncbi:PREDICTED: uncharacterized protein LOC105364097 [Ceratosolen solmsi marchali]|uniref:Uncharacterized protein LOC105364097 n=1 Tax=Ceratosolen solmsi marchali TaxID=326594 RepID=A0AAJ6YLH8_9HYME|nr:PREDICTED: uncharacterized protein LOC105364097 [Ceratosolen solmsi marchali]
MGLAILGLLVSVLCLTADEIEAERSGWNVNPETQYHIQTDEGPERYFRFQTLNGQYRKEKRLEDGTVIGTEGWLDPLGYLRIKDYIADTKGYRILKSKMIYVGKERPIQDAVAISKSVPASGGSLVRPVRPPNPFRQPELKDVASNSIEASPVTPLRSSAAPILVTTPRPRPFALTTPASFGPDYSQPDSNYLSSSHKPYRGSYRLKQQQRQQQHQQPRKPALVVEPPFLNQDQNHLVSRSSSAARLAPNAFRGYQRWNGSGGRFPQRQKPATREYEFPGYDGNHGTKDGFQYYLKKQYHEEERTRPDKSIGSFGYVDPFGIRRVVYYKADSQNGFQHRKNNRYVGHDAKPYDPVPLVTAH